MGIINCTSRKNNVLISLSRYQHKIINTDDPELNVLSNYTTFNWSNYISGGSALWASWILGGYIPSWHGGKLLPLAGTPATTIKDQDVDFRSLNVFTLDSSDPRNNTFNKWMKKSGYYKWIVEPQPAWSK